MTDLKQGSHMSTKLETVTSPLYSAAPSALGLLFKETQKPPVTNTNSF